MKCKFTLKECALIYVGLDNTGGGKVWLKSVIKWEGLLEPTPEEHELTGAVMTPEGLGIVPGTEDVIVERELPLKALRTFLQGVDGCVVYPGKFRHVVIALLAKLTEYVKDEAAIVAYSKLPKKEREADRVCEG